MKSDPRLLTKVGVVALTIGIAGALAVNVTSSFALDADSDARRLSFQTSDARIQCNDGWAYDPLKQFCVRTPSSARPRQPQSLSPRPTRPRGSSPTKRRIVEAAGMRTLCVRACDGYYFPISHTATRKRLKIDEAVCKAMYGRAAADLYFHHTGSTVDTAVSLKGKPLALEPHAFAFRNTFNETCQAELKKGLARLVVVFMAKVAEGPSLQAGGRGDASGLLAHPARKVVAGTDPETISNRAGNLDGSAVRSSSERSTAGWPNIRRIGPDYYYRDPVTIARLRDRPVRRPVFTLVGSSVPLSAQ